MEKYIYVEYCWLVTDMRISNCSLKIVMIIMIIMIVMLMIKEYIRSNSYMMANVNMIHIVNFKTFFIP